MKPGKLVPKSDSRRGVSFRAGRISFIGVMGLVLAASLAAVRAQPAELEAAGSAGATATQTYVAKGLVEAVDGADRTVVIQHEAISNFMAAMTMPFKVKSAAEAASLRPGDAISFQLHVTGTESWIDHITKTGTVSAVATNPSAASKSEVRNAKSEDFNPQSGSRNPLLDCAFTNELGEAVRLSQFHGQALAITFFFTRCPLPEYCPRLSRNFQEASQRLSALAGAPTNWHFLSISFDVDNDTPAVLKAYGETYHYDLGHWNFLTGPADKIGELARASGVTFSHDGLTINHNFRTLIVDATGRLQTTFPFGGDLSDAIVAEVLKAAVATNMPATGSEARIPLSGLRSPNFRAEPPTDEAAGWVAH